MKTKLLATGLLATALIAAPLAPAEAHGWHHGGGGAIFGLGAAVGAVVVGAAMLATAPVRIIADAASPPPAPVYAAPAPVVYATPGYAYPGYYYPHRVVYAYPAYGYPGY